jgi:WSC domain
VTFELRPTSYRSAFRPASTAGDPEWDVTETVCHGSNIAVVGPRPDDGSSLYQGCYEDRSDRALPDSFTTSLALTPSSCRSFCAAAGKSYAGLQFGSECWCGSTNPANANPPYALKTGECTTPCSGDAAVACGGTWRNSVYRTGIN